VGAQQRFDRRQLAVAVTSDGRRVQVPFETNEASPLSLLRSILVVIEGLIGLLITDTRRVHRGTRRNSRP
jgi:hypothetical protein